MGIWCCHYEINAWCTLMECEHCNKKMDNCSFTWGGHVLHCNGYGVDMVCRTTYVKLVVLISLDSDRASGQAKRHPGDMRGGPPPPFPVWGQHGRHRRWGLGTGAAHAGVPHGHGGPLGTPGHHWLLCHGPRSVCRLFSTPTCQWKSLLRASRPVVKQLKTFLFLFRQAFD